MKTANEIHQELRKLPLNQAALLLLRKFKVTERGAFRLPILALASAGLEEDDPEHEEHLQWLAYAETTPRRTMVETMEGLTPQLLLDSGSLQDATRFVLAQLDPNL